MALRTLLLAVRLCQYLNGVPASRTAVLVFSLTGCGLVCIRLRRVDVILVPCSIYPSEGERLFTLPSRCDYVVQLAGQWLLLRFGAENENLSILPREQPLVGLEDALGSSRSVSS